MPPTTELGVKFWERSGGSTKPPLSCLRAPCPGSSPTHKSDRPTLRPRGRRPILVLPRLFRELWPLPPARIGQAPSCAPQTEDPEKRSLTKERLHPRHRSRAAHARWEPTERSEAGSPEGVGGMTRAPDGQRAARAGTGSLPEGRWGRGAAPGLRWPVRPGL